eukprot:gene7006-11171_t
MNVDDEIKRARKEREKLKSYEEPFYKEEKVITQKKKKRKYESDEDEETTYDQTSNWRKMAQQYSAPEQYLNESAKIIENENPKDVFDDFRVKTIADRENSYTSRWRKRELSPDKKDKKTYSERLLENQLEREKQDVLFKLQKQEREEKRKEELEKKRKKLEEEREQEKLKQQKKNQNKIEHTSNKTQTEEEKQQEDEPITVKDEPNYQPSGKLYKGTNTLNGKDLKWFEPPELKLPTKNWRLHVFKKDKQIGEPYKIYKQTNFLFGKDRGIADIPIDHESCSKQHAVLCFREVDGKKKKKVKPYVIDLKSTNGTFLNDEKLDDSRYYELHEFDVLKFGFSTREYLILHEESNL